MRTGRSSGLSWERVAGTPLQVLTRFCGSDLAERLHLREPVLRLIRHGTRAGLQAARAGAAFPRRPAQGEATRLGASKSDELFDPTPTDEQARICHSMRRFADEVLRPAARRADDDAAPPEAVLAQGHALGLASLAIPEALGGGATERSAVINTLVAEELARGDMGLAIALLAPIAFVHAVVEWGSAEQQARYLPSFLDHDVAAGLAILEPHPLADPMEPRTGAVRAEGGGWELWGEKSLVPLATRAGAFVVSANVRGLGARLFVIERGTPGLAISPEPAMGLRGAALGHLRFERARVDADAMLGGVRGDGATELGALVDRARIAWGAMAVGTSQAVLDYIVPYCKERQAFGEPISNRQAIAFLVADIAIELEGMRLLVRRAASRVDLDALPPGSIARAASQARLQCANKGVRIGSDGVQALGGHGFIKEHPVERWYRDLRAIGVLEGALLV